MPETSSTHTRKGILIACQIATFAATVAAVLISLPPVSSQEPAKPAPQGRGPDIKFESLTHNFGQVPEGKNFPFDFYFINNGDATLQITNVKPSCGCTTVTAKLDKSAEPGKTGKIPAVYDTHNADGPFKRSIAVSTNVPGKELLTLWLEGTVYHPVKVFPDRIFMKVLLEPDKKKSIAVSVASGDQKPFEIKKITLDNQEIFAVSPVTVVKAGEEYTFEVSTVPPVRQNTQPHQATVTIETTHPDKPVILLPVSCFNPPPKIEGATPMEPVKPVQAPPQAEPQEMP